MEANGTRIRSIWSIMTNQRRGTQLLYSPSVKRYWDHTCTNRETHGEYIQTLISIDVFSGGCGAVNQTGDDLNCEEEISKKEAYLSSPIF